MEEKQVIASRIPFDENAKGQGEPSLGVRGRFERFKVFLIGVWGLSVFAAALMVFFFIGMILALPVILLGLFWTWRMRRSFGRHSGPSVF